MRCSIIIGSRASLTFDPLPSSSQPCPRDYDYAWVRKALPLNGWIRSYSSFITVNDRISPRGLICQNEF